MLKHKHIGLSEAVHQAEHLDRDDCLEAYKFDKPRQTAETVNLPTDLKSVLPAVLLLCRGNL